MPSIVLTIIMMPLLGALIGWITNWLAIRMLFRPRNPIRIFMFSWQGLIPQRQADVARKTAEVIERDILEKHLLRQEIGRIDLEPYIEGFATRLVYESVAPRLKKIPLLGNFIGEGVLQKLQRIAVEAMRKEAKPLILRIASEAEKRFDIRRLVEERIASFDLDRLEAVVNAVAQREFRAIEIMGAVVGLLVGVGQLILLVLTGRLDIG